MANKQTTVPIERLEQQLGSIMELMWAAHHSSRIQREFEADERKRSLYSTGLIEHYRDWEQHLLQIKSMDEYDVERFTFKQHQPSNLFDLRAEFEAVAAFAYAFAYWTLSSRRVYTPSLELQAQHVLTHLGKNTMDDVLWPYPAFCVGVERALVDPASQQCFDMFLVCPSHAPGNAADRVSEAYSIFALNQRLHTWKPYAARSKVDRLMSEGRFVAANDRLIDDKEPLDRNERLLPTIRTLPIASGQPIEEVLLDCSNFEKQMWRMVIAFVQYVAATRETAAQVGPWTKSQRGPRAPVLDTPVGKLITNTSQLCHVTSVHRLTAGECEQHFKAAQNPTGAELMYHLRIAHKRARHGERARLGSLAEKVVRIPSVPVRPDRKPASGVTGGAIVET